MKKRLKRGKDWHGWAWKASSADNLNGLHFYALADRPDTRRNDYLPPTEKGKWVRVRFVEAKRS